MTATAVQRFDGFEPSQRDALKKDDNVPLMSMLVEECAQASKRPAEVVYDFRQNQFKNTTEALPLSLLTETSPAKREGIEDAFVIPNVLNAEECHELIHRAETSGILPPYKVLRTAKRTEKYQDQDFSDKLRQKVGSTFSQQLSMHAGSNVHQHCGDFYGIHPNWRVVRYDSGDTFQAHQDQMDSIQQWNPETKQKDYLVSTHTLLIQLAEPQEGGATRFYPRAKVKGKNPGQYDHAIDVLLPKGWALVFPQLGLVHAGQPVHGDEPKYIAQAGVLRTLPQGRLLRPSVFRLGPGLTDLYEATVGKPVN